MSSSQTSNINPDVLRAWCDTPSHFLPPDLPAASAEGGHSEGSSPRRHRYTPAEISQQSVDLLLREYYKMVTAQRHSSLQQGEGAGEGLLQRAFLLLCPAPPACVELDQLLKVSIKAVQLTARVVVLAACVGVPVWLGLIRQAYQHHGPVAAAQLAAAGLLVLLMCDAIHRSAAKQQAAEQAACVTAATLQEQLHAGAGATHELATLRAASKTATTSNSSRPNSITLQQQPRQQQQQQPAQRGAAAAPASAKASTSAGGGVNGSAVSSSYAALQQDLTALQAELGVCSSSTHAPGSEQHAVDVLSQLCGELGLQLTPDMTASPAAMAGVIAQLKERVGI